MGRSYRGIPARWAESLTDGRIETRARAERCSFDGRWFYSYNTPVARFVNGMVLIAKEVKSVSTNSHKREAIYACQAVGLEVFHVRFIGSGQQGWSNEPTFLSTDEMHKANIVIMWQEIQEVAKSFENPFKWHRTANWHDVTWHLWKVLSEYAHMAKVDRPFTHEYELLIKRTEIERERRFGAYNDPVKVARRVRAAARRQALKACIDG